MVNENSHQRRSRQYQDEKETLTLAWHAIQQKLVFGQLVRGVVTRHEPFGIFMDIGQIFECLVQITEFPGEHKKSIKDFPPIGNEVEARIMGFSTFQNMLTMK